MSKTFFKVRIMDNFLLLEIEYLDQTYFSASENNEAITNSLNPLDKRVSVFLTQYIIVTKTCFNTL
jgi:hypothetical protein